MKKILLAFLIFIASGILLANTIIVSSISALQNAIGRQKRKEEPVVSSIKENNL